MAKARKSKSRGLTTRTKRPPKPAGAGRLVDDVRRLIDDARQQVARAVNAGLVALNWHVGHRIRQDILGERRAEYGQRIVATLSRQLVPDFGAGFSEKNLWRMVQFAERFPDEQIVATLPVASQRNVTINMEWGIAARGTLPRSRADAEANPHVEVRETYPS